MILLLHTLNSLSKIENILQPRWMARLPELPRTDTGLFEPKQPVLGEQLTRSELRADLLTGSSGLIGKKLAEAARKVVDPAILAAGRRAPLKQQKSSDKSRGSGGKGATRNPARESELIGDIGEAFVHEWLMSILDDEYGPDCWVSKSRARYGLAASGSDDYGFDFHVPHSPGRILEHRATSLLIEVKSTTTDGGGSFPMSLAEWEKARECHEADDGSLYVIVRVNDVLHTPHIGDILVDPFGAFKRGEVSLANRDLWVTVAPLITEP